MVAGDQVAGTVLPELWHEAPADLAGVAAAGVEAAAGGRTGRARALTAEQHRPHDLVRVRLGDRRHEGLGVGMSGPVVERLGRSDFDQLSQVHHGHPVTGMGDGGQIVGDEQIGQVELRLQFFQEVEDLRLDRHVERRDRLVADDELRMQHQRPGDRDPLPLAAAEGVRVATEMLHVETAALRHVPDPFVQLRAPGELVGDQRLADHVAHRHARVQRRIGILEDHLHVPPHGPEALAVEPCDVDLGPVAPVDDPAGGRLDGAQHGAT